MQRSRVAGGSGRSSIVSSVKLWCAISDDLNSSRKEVGDEENSSSSRVFVAAFGKYKHSSTISTFQRHTQQKSHKDMRCMRIGIFVYFFILFYFFFCFFLR
ncbi:unnamed protein product [Ceratitis capitata]|uniref:(Mediterranean fruit fly) hypothetical protein n=1 Tax=Ceratitis capitata TaxID=7213 RepID=A0A811U5H9_CERCA|nr:unnamed protein product [Ceratitis capitata]